MKTLYLSLFILQSAFGQINSDYLEFYPLKTDNYWEYEEIIVTYDTMWLPIYETNYFSISILGDTLLQNGRKYYILQEHRITDKHHYYNYSFERIDSLSGNVFRFNDEIENSECLIDSLKAQIGDSSRANRRYCSNVDRPIIICSRDTSEYLFNDLRRIKYFECCADFIISCPEYGLIEHLGLFEMYWEFDFGWHKNRLIYAEIDNKKYGTSVLLSLDNITKYPAGFQLFQNYPNPFNSSTVITFSLSQTQAIFLELFDIKGKRIKTLFSGVLNSGLHSVTIDGTNLSSGVYYYALTTSQKKSVKKCVLVK